MKNSIAKINHKHKLWFIFLLILGNALMALLSFSGESISSQPHETVQRPHYTEIRIKGFLRTLGSSERPVTLIGSSKQVIIKDVFIVKKFEKNIEQDLFALEDKHELSYNDYLVSIPEDQALAALSEKSFEIYPNNLPLKIKQRKSYEINY